MTVTSTYRIYIGSYRLMMSCPTAFKTLSQSIKKIPPISKVIQSWPSSFSSAAFFRFSRGFLPFKLLPSSICVANNENVASIIEAVCSFAQARPQRGSSQHNQPGISGMISENVTV